MVHRKRRRPRLVMRECRERHHAAAGRAHVDVVERGRIQPEARVDHHHDVVLVQRRVRGRDLALTERIVEHGVDGLRRDAEPSRGGAVDDQIRREPLVLRVVVHVGQLMDALHRFEQDRAPMVQRVQVVALDRVLILGGRLSAADAHVLHRLQEQRGARHHRELRTQAIDDLIGARFALRERLQGDEHAPGVGRRSAAAARERQHGIHSGVLLGDGGEPLNLPLHRLKRNRLVGDDAAVQPPGVLLREESLGYLDVQVHGEPHGGDGDDQHEERVDRAPSAGCARSP